MTAATQPLTVYRTILRELRLGDTLHKYRQHRRTSTIYSSVRQAFTAHANTQKQDLRALTELAAFLRANRLHQGLLERYNAGINMTQEERSRLTARRVGLNMPVEYSDTGKQ